MQRTYDLKLGTAVPLIRSVFSCETLKTLRGSMPKQILLYNNLIVWFQEAPIFDVVQKKHNKKVLFGNMLVLRGIRERLKQSSPKKTSKI